jgi:hypothetical protein
VLGQGFSLAAGGRIDCGHLLLSETLILHISINFLVPGKWGLF